MVDWGGARELRDAKQGSGEEWGEGEKTEGARLSWGGGARGEGRHSEERETRKSAPKI